METKQNSIFTMKNLCFFLLLFAGIANGQIVNIPDGNFKAKLLSSAIGIYVAGDINGNNISIDANNDNEIQMSEALVVHRLYVDSASISDLTGIAAFTNLETLGCFNNQLTSLDLSANPILNSIFCWNNNLSYVNIKNGFNMTNVDSDFSNNPNLNFICIDDGEADILHHIMEFTTGVPAVNYNSYCSFITGGNYNTITGTAVFDANNNGCDPGDFANPYIKININNGTATSTTFTNAAGNYTFDTQAGNFTLSPAIENPSFFTFSPASSVINFPVVNNSVTIQNFCMTANGVNPDLEVVFVWQNSIVPGVDSRQYILYKNKGNQSLSGTIIFDFEDDRLDLLSTTPVATSQALNTATWSYSNLQPFETRLIGLVLHANSSSQTPALNIGDSLTFSASGSIIGDIFPADNTSVTHIVVSSSWDPNDKTCLEGNTIAATEIGKYVHYNINFENIGTSEAINIVVKDTINTSKFDINSLQLIYASHPVETKITGNIVEFIFQDISLPPSSINPIGGHGNVLFKIKTLPTLHVGDEISNTANIYFDYNAPIVTNEARSAYTALSTQPFIKDESITIYPNPTKNTIAIHAKNNLQSIELFDVQGRILQSAIENKNAATLDISTQSSGVYFIKITTDRGSVVEKIIKE